MRIKYMFFTAAIYIGVFLAAYLAADILFMIFEIPPYIKLAAVIVLMIADVYLTDMIVNRKLYSYWLRDTEQKTDDSAKIIKAPDEKKS